MGKGEQTIACTLLRVGPLLLCSSPQKRGRSSWVVCVYLGMEVILGMDVHRAGSLFWGFEMLSEGDARS